MGKIIVIMGKSASGKDTIFKYLKEKMDLKTIITYTTRPIREGERNKEDYYFVTEKEFYYFQKEKKILEYRYYHTIYGIWYYFTVDDGQINLKKDNYIIIGTLEAYEQIKNYYGKDKVMPIYIEVEDGIRLERALYREKIQKYPKYAEMCRRFLADEKDFSEENLKKMGIEERYNNINIEDCIQKITKKIGKLKNM